MMLFISQEQNFILIQKYMRKNLSILKMLSLKEKYVFIIANFTTQSVLKIPLLIN